MVVGFVTRNLQAIRVSAERTRRLATAGALLASSVADVNIITNWTYFHNGSESNEDLVPSWLKTFHLVACVLGSFAWIAVASDAWLIQMIRRVVFCSGEKRGFAASNIVALFIGIAIEGILQIIVTILVEDYIRDGEQGSLSTTAVLNLTFASLDILHKLAEVYDTRNEILEAVDESALSNLQILNGHSSYVTSISLGGSKNRVLTTSYDNTARLWDAAKGKLLKTFNDHKNCVNDVCLLDQDRLVTVSDDKTAKIIDIESGKCLKTLHHYQNVNCVAVSPNGRFFLTGCSDGRLQTWDSATYDEISSRRNNTTSISFIDSERFVTSSLESKEAKLWTEENGDEPLFTYRGHSSDVVVVAKLTMESFLTGSRDSSIKQWSTNGERCLVTFKGHTSVVRGIARVNDTKFVSTSHDTTARLWDTTDASCLMTYKSHEGDVRDAVFLAGQSAVATVSHDKTIRVWSIKKYLNLNGEKTPKESDVISEEDISDLA